MPRVAHERPLYMVPRLWVDETLMEGAPITKGARLVLSDTQAHYLKNVMRARVGACVRLFNATMGEWAAEVCDYSPRSVALRLDARLRAPEAHPRPPLILYPALLKGSAFETVITKAVELGVTHIQPLITARTQRHVVKPERLVALSREAAEQSERLDVPVCAEPLALPSCLSQWPTGRVALVAAEMGKAVTVADGVCEALTRYNPCAGVGLFVGPEGGFTEEERALFARVPSIVAVRLGTRILRADTAGLVLITCWQALAGDWGR